MDIRNSAPFVGMPLLLLLVQVGAILLSPRMQEAGVAAFEDPSSAANPIIFIGILLIFTLLMLFLIKRGSKHLMAVLIAVSIFFSLIYIFSAISSHFFGFTLIAGGITLASAVLATALLHLYPEWYVIDVIGVLIAAGIASIFGISLEIIPVIILLVLLAIYDAISVYRTKHMISLAEGIIELKTPILVVIPKTRSYSYIREGLSMEGGERGAFVMGLGDLIMPTILAVSAHVFIDAPLIAGFTGAPALGAMIGTFGGLGVLMYFVNRGNPQAGLPALNGGAIAGFLIACALTGTWGWIPGV
ncbi:MAG: presenilin family intramembrane aspartyl protease [Methanomicrobiaceae archaeon]|nr:presenilin family intramembrane aspartyl protease [Methanomicrobiaceae archaeon]